MFSIFDGDSSLFHATSVFDLRKLLRQRIGEWSWCGSVLFYPAIAFWTKGRELHLVLLCVKLVDTFIKLNERIYKQRDAYCHSQSEHVDKGGERAFPQASDRNFEV